MPASLFEPANALALAAYAEATLRLYNNPNSRAGPLGLGNCAQIGYIGPSAGRVAASWFGRGAPGDNGGLMGQVCAERCQCSYQGAGPEDLPFCRPVQPNPFRVSICAAHSINCDGQLNSRAYKYIN